MLHCPRPRRGGVGGADDACGFPSGSVRRPCRIRPCGRHGGRRLCWPTPPLRCAPGSRATARSSARAMDREQRATHGLAWLATYVEAVSPACLLCGANAGRRAIWRAGGPAGPDRARRISGPDARRHPHEPGRDRASRPTSASPRPGRGAADGRRRGLIASGNTPANRARLVELMRAHPGHHGRRLRPVRHAGCDPRGDAQVRRKRGRPARPRLASDQQLHPARHHHPHGRTRGVRPHHPGAVRRHGARQGVRCASSPRSCRAAISVWARSGPDQKLPRSSSSAPAPRRRSRHGCRRSPPARCCRPPFSPSRTPAPTSPRSRPARCAKATSIASTATRPGSPIRPVPT